VNLTHQQIIEVAEKTRTAESRDGDYILPISFAEAVIKANDEARPVAAGTIDTPSIVDDPEFIRLSIDFRDIEADEDNETGLELAAHIDQRIAAAYAKGRADAVRDYISTGHAATAPVSAVPEMKCGTCGVDRLKEGCPTTADHCTMVGVAHSRRPVSPSAGAPVSAAEDNGAAQNAPSSPQTRIDASSEVLLDAVGKLVKAKGRFHTEQNYRAVVAAYDSAIAAKQAGKEG
jgi:hypothetical protein